jgi:hypothetical protein
MDISTAHPIQVAQMLGGVSLRQQHEAAILKMSNDQIKQDGANVMALLQAVPGAKPQGPLGNHLDVTA